MLNIIQNTIGALARKGLSVIRNGLKMWLPFEKSEILGEELINSLDFNNWTNSGAIITSANSFTTSGSGKGVYYTLLPNKTYRINVSGVEGDVSLRYRDGGGAGTVLGNFDTNLYFSTHGFTSPNIYLRASSSTTCSVDNISVKEVTQIAPDKSGNSNSAKLFTGKALSFDGINDYVDFGSDVNSNGTVWTTAIWIGDYTAGSYDWIYGDDNTKSIGLNYGGGTTGDVFYKSHDSTYNYFSCEEFKSDFTNAKRLIFTSDGTDISLYIDGELIDTITPTTTNLTISRLMAGFNTTSYLVAATVSDFQLYDTAWTQDDVTFDYNNPQHLVTDNSELRYGSEEVDNGDFAELPLGTGWDNYTSGSSTVAFTEGAILSIDGSNSNIGVYQQNIFTSGVQYKIVVSVKATASFDALVSETDAASSKGTIGTLNLTTSYQDFSFYYTGTGAWDLFIHRKFGETAGQNQQIYIKDISVKEVLSPTLNNLKGYWHLSEGDGIMVYDSSGDGNLGYIYNGLTIGATWVHQQATIPQLGLMDWAKSTPVADEITLIADPNNPSEDILGNSVRLREHSLNLDGIGYAEVPDADNLDFGTDFTLECWIQPTGSDAYNGLITKYSPDTEWDLIINNGQPRMALRGSSQIDDAGTGFPDLRDNDWHHIVKVCSTTSIISYLNGSIVHTKSGTWTANTSKTSNILIGARNGVNDFDGLIDDARIYNRALSSDEVEQNHKAGLNKHKASSSFSDDFSSDYGF